MRSEPHVDRRAAVTRSHLIDRYRDLLPVEPDMPVVSLLEGETPLVRARKIEASLPTSLTVLLKLEGMNPTGSFKDRGMTVAVSKAVDGGARAVICASTGNTSASAAAYAAHAGIDCVVLVPAGGIALGKIAQALMHGARVLAVRGGFDDALRLVRELSSQYPFTLVNSINPDRIEGQKTAAFEICDELGGAPDYLCIPVGNAGNITAYWKGFTEYHERGRVSALPVLCGFQAAGAAPLVAGSPVAEPRTVATAIRIGYPASWEGAVRARDESGGTIAAVSDQEILSAYGLLAREEGVFVEPASAASVAGLMKLAGEGFFPGGSVVVAVLTGHGLKDPGLAVEHCRRPVEVESDLEAVLELLGVE